MVSLVGLCAALHSAAPLPAVRDTGQRPMTSLAQKHKSLSLKTQRRAQVGGAATCMLELRAGPRGAAVSEPAVLRLGAAEVEEMEGPEVRRIEVEGLGSVGEGLGAFAGEVGGCGGSQKRRLQWADDGLCQDWIASRFQTALQSSPPPPTQKQESSKGNDYYVNVGYAIRTLREELPGLFYRPPSFDIYRDDITFCDPLNTFRGIENYKLIFWALRFHGRIFFRSLWVDVGRVWQPSDKVIMVRWSVRGRPRVPWEAQGQFDGTSEYKLDKDGKIYEHKVDNVVMSNQQRFQPVSAMDLLRLVGARTTPTPTYFERVSLFLGLIAPYLALFTWVRFYWALRSTLALTETLESLALSAC